MEMDYDHDIYLYTGFRFERVIYLFVWEFLVTLTCFANLIIIVVLMRKTMRSATNIILVAIAVSDSLTGLVTFPSYIAVYQKYGRESEDPYLNTLLTLNETYNEYPQYLTSDNGSLYFEDYQNPREIYIELDKQLCRYFMTSKFFVSRIFHTISIWLTLLLGLQRFIFVAFPFKPTKWASNIKNTAIVCVIITFCSPIIHMYHLFDEKAEDGFCRWSFGGRDYGALSYTWITLLLVHFIPCASLVVLTLLFCVNIWKGSIAANRMNIITSNRITETRRILIIVTAIVVVFLVSELPYGGFLLYTVIQKQAQKEFNLETNRLIHATYELLLVLSFHANFYIYMLLSRKFRRTLRLIFSDPINRMTCSFISRKSSTTSV